MRRRWTRYRPGGSVIDERAPRRVNGELVLVAAVLPRDVEHHVRRHAEPRDDDLAQDRLVSRRHVEGAPGTRRSTGTTTADANGQERRAAQSPQPESPHALGFFQIPRSCMSRIWRLMTFWRYSACFMGARFR